MTEKILQENPGRFVLFTMIFGSIINNRKQVFGLLRKLTYNKM